MPVEISIIVVTHKSQPLIDRCLAPILLARRSDIEVVVWDNASPDNTVDYIRANYPAVKLIASTENLGFAKGNNAALTHCTGSVIVLLSPDAFIGDITDLIDMAHMVGDDPKIAAVGPQLINADSSHQVGDAGWNATMRSIIGHHLFIHSLNADFPSTYVSNPRLLRRQHVDVDWICGACLITRRDVLDSVGGLSADISMYGEDVEWYEHCRTRGYRLVYLPGHKVTHLQGATQRSEKEFFFSTKAMEALALRMSQRLSSTGFVGFCLILCIGYAMRAGAYQIMGRIKSSPQLIAKGGVMWRYAKHAVRLHYQPLPPHS